MSRKNIPQPGESREEETELHLVPLMETVQDAGIVEDAGPPPQSASVQPLPLPQVPSGPPSQTLGGGRTTLISPRLLEARVPVSEAKEPTAAAKMRPVVGWLAILAGPGRGQTFPLSYGINQVGSHVENGIRLRFGDLQISDLQALIIYDHQRRKFFLHHKGGRVATFVNGEPVLKLTPLAPHQDLVMGRTKLRLIPLCGPDFDWTQK